MSAVLSRNMISSVQASGVRPSRSISRPTRPVRMVRVNNTRPSPNPISAPMEPVTDVAQEYAKDVAREGRQEADDTENPEQKKQIMRETAQKAKSISTDSFQKATSPAEGESGNQQQGSQQGSQQGRSAEERDNQDYSPEARLNTPDYAQDIPTAVRESAARHQEDVGNQQANWMQDKTADFLQSFTPSGTDASAPQRDASDK